MNKNLLYILIAILIAGVAYFMYQQNLPMSEPLQEDQTTSETSMPSGDESLDSPESVDKAVDLEIKQLDMEIENIPEADFNPEELSNEKLGL
jgi:hypothetical protein